MKLTKMEFLQFLTRAMIGEAHSTMIGYLDLFRSGQMSIKDIYLSLTDLYFTEMRPAVALDKLHALSENSHPYFSLSEAHNGILYLANLASLASHTEQRLRLRLRLKFIRTQLAYKKYKKFLKALR